MSKTVRVVNLVNPVIFRAERPTTAFDDAHHVVPRDLDLSNVVTEGIDRATVKYWADRTKGGLRWEFAGDTVLVSVDNGRSPREQLAAERRALERDRAADERQEIAAARQQIAAERAAIEHRRLDRKRR